MEDRVSLYPGRVMLIPVEGQPNTYDMVRADKPIQTGTSLGKVSLLKDTTAAQFGLGSEAVPDDVLSWVGKYNEYWWSLLHSEAYSYYAEKQTLNSSSVSFNGSNSGDANIYYSKDIEISDDGSISLKEPITTIKYSSWVKNALKELCDNAPIYMKMTDEINLATHIFYIPGGATYDSTSWSTNKTTFNGEVGANSTSMNVCAPSDESICARIVTSTMVNVPAGETTYEHSMNRNAYPDSGTVDGVTYTFLGKPFEKFPTMPQIETGSYIGTGTYGSNNPNSLTFTKPPQLVIIQDINGVLDLRNSGYVVFVRGVTEFVGPTYTYMTGGTVFLHVFLYLSWDDNTVTWYCDSSNSETAKTQMNESGDIYNYIAIG